MKFQIGIDGKVSNATIAKSLSKSCDAAAIEAVESMPDWTPAMNEGQPVATELTLPIRFQLD